MQTHVGESLLNWKRKLLCLFFYILEILSLKNRLAHRIYLKWIGEIFVDEFRMAEITPEDQVLHIGCGCLPTTAVLVAKESHAKVVAIDNNPKAIHGAREFVSQQHLTDYITIDYGDGTTYPLDSFDVIFIAMNVTPVEAVFHHIATNAKSQVRIICRDFGSGVIHLLQNQEFLPIFSIQSVHLYSKTSSLFITKK